MAFCTILAVADAPCLAFEEAARLIGVFFVGFWCCHCSLAAIPHARYTWDSLHSNSYPIQCHSATEAAAVVVVTQLPPTLRSFRLPKSLNERIDASVPPNGSRAASAGTCFVPSSLSWLKSSFYDSFLRTVPLMVSWIWSSSDDSKDC